jgi:hypothetical protein
MLFSSGEHGLFSEIPNPAKQVKDRYSREIAGYSKLLPFFPVLTLSGAKGRDPYRHESHKANSKSKGKSFHTPAVSRL